MKGYVITYDTVDVNVDYGHVVPLNIKVLTSIGGDGTMPIVHTRWMDARRYLDTWLKMVPGYANMDYYIQEVEITNHEEKGWRRAWFNHQPTQS